MLRHTYVTTMQVCGVASAASFGKFRDRWDDEGLGFDGGAGGR